MKRAFCILLMCLGHFAWFSALFLPIVAHSQQAQPGMMEIGSFHFHRENQKVATIPFELVHNLILVPLSINGSDSLTFIVDTGVTTTLITNLPAAGSIDLNYTREIEINGLGSGRSVKALHSTGNTFTMGEAIGFNHELLVLTDDIFQISASMGRHVHGLIGYDLFKNFVVEINYQKRYLALYHPNKAAKKISKMLRQHARRDRLVPIEIEKMKPYLHGRVFQENGSKVDVRMLIDSGASHALSLYSLSDSSIIVPENAVYSFLGSGLNGDIFGHIGRTESLKLHKFSFDAPIVSYPDEEGVRRAMNITNRNGSLGAEILKRFRVIFDYRHEAMMLKPNRGYKLPFRYNMSGIDIITPIPGIPIYEISKVRGNSPAKKAGLARGDQIITINGINAAQFSLNEILDIFQSRSGKKVRLSVQRYNLLLKTEFVLKDNI